MFYRLVGLMVFVLWGAGSPVTHAQVQPDETVNAGLQFQFNPDWQQAFAAGESVIEPAQLNVMEIESFGLQQDDETYFMTGKLLGRDLVSCDGTPIARLQDNPNIDVGYYVREYPFVALLLRDRHDGTYDLLDVRAYARSGYCGEPPVKKPFDGGTLSSKSWSGSPVMKWPFEIWPCWPNSNYGARILPLHFWPQTELLPLLYQHEGWEVSVQGSYNRGLMIMNAIERVIFVQPEGCGEKHTAFLPLLDCDNPGLKLGRGCSFKSHVPVVLNRSDPEKPWPKGPTIYLPHVSAVVPLRGDKTMDVEVLEETDTSDSEDQDNDSWPMCALNTAVLVTEDGASVSATITSTKESKIPTWQLVGDRVHLLMGDRDDRLTHNWISPGRVDAVPCEMLLTSNSNQAHSLVLRIREGSVFEVGYPSQDGKRFLWNGAVKAGKGVDGIYEFWAAYDGAFWPSDMVGGPFGVTKLRLDVSNPFNVSVRQLESYETQWPVYEMVATQVQGRKLLHLVDEGGSVHSIDPDSMQLVRKIKYERVYRLASDEKRFSWHNGAWLHVTTSLDGRYLIIGSGKESGVTVVDLQMGSSWSLWTPAVRRILGVAVKHNDGDIKGMLLIHGTNSLLVMRPNANWTQLETVAFTGLPEEALQEDAYLAGPQMTVGWVYGNQFVAAIAQPDPRNGYTHRFEFGLFEVNLNTNVVELIHVYDLTWDPKQAWPNDTWQCESGWNTDCSGPPMPTPTPGPSATPRPTNTSMPQPSPTPTRPCVPSTQYADIVLVVDNSSSMAGEKFAAAQAGARQFVDNVKAPNQVALVSFAESAVLRQPLTTDFESMQRAISILQVGQGTRLDLGLDTAWAELKSERHVDSHVKVMVVLTDGRQDQVQEVKDIAAAAKVEGTIIFTIGLGGDADQELLKKVATSPGHYFYAPGSADLANIYKEVAKTIPCP